MYSKERGPVTFLYNDMPRANDSLTSARAPLVWDILEPVVEEQDRAHHFRGRHDGRRALLLRQEVVGYKQRRCLRANHCVAKKDEYRRITL